mgnify:CR=1 FL=1
MLVDPRGTGSSNRLDCDIPDELLVRFRAGTAPAHGATLHAAAGAVPLRSFATVRDLHLVKLPGAHRDPFDRMLIAQKRRALQASE